jgi:hypothetical protein
MPRRKSEPLDTPIPAPATTLEGRNDQLIDAAFDLAERRLHDGTASAQEVVHFLRLGATTQRLHEEKLRNENLVLETRVEEMKARTTGEDLYAEALNAFRGYSGQVQIDVEDESYY